MQNPSGNRPAIEHRSFPIEFRASSGGAPKLEGYAAVFNRESEVMLDFVEIIAPGAFSKTIAEDDARAFWNHNGDFVLGRKGNNTLKLREDATGLAVEIYPPDTQTARDLLESIRRGDVHQMSFGFRVRDEQGESWRYDKARGLYVRTLLDLRLFEVSPVAIPAYPNTTIAARSRPSGFGPRGLDIFRGRLKLLDLDLNRINRSSDGDNR